MMSEQLLLWGFCSGIQLLSYWVSNKQKPELQDKLGLNCMVKPGGDVVEKEVPFTGSPTVKYCFIVHVYL